MKPTGIIRRLPKPICARLSLKYLFSRALYCLWIYTLKFWLDKSLWMFLFTFKLKCFNVLFCFGKFSNFVFVWSFIDINEILISEVAKRPLLYKAQTCQQEKGAKHLQRRQQWTEVYNALNQLIPLTKLPKIWKNIRDRYHKVRRVASIVGDEKPKYRYFEQLSFLDPVMEDQKTIEYEHTE